MSGALRKTMVYLGLAEDDDRYSAYDEYEDEEFETAPVEEEEREEPRRAPVTPIGGRSQVARVVAHPSSEIHRITTIHPRTYNEAKTIGESFRAGTPVIMNLTDMDDADAKPTLAARDAEIRFALAALKVAPRLAGALPVPRR